MIYNNDLYHHGIKGQKWGVRRYQNEDGSLTDAGRKRYSYGSVSVQYGKKEGEPGTVTISNKSKSLEVSDKSFRDLEKSSSNEVLNAVAASNNMSMKKVISIVNKDSNYRHSVNDLIDSYMEMKLTDLLDSHGTNKPKESNKLSVNNKTSKPKYTQEQAIDKAYSDLEKKYPNFNKMSQDKQDQLFMEYAEESGLMDYMFD